MQEPMPTGFEVLATMFGLSLPVFIALFVVVSVWTLAVKGYALWHAARDGQRIWFIVLLIANTFGILELAYLLFFRAKRG